MITANSYFSGAGLADVGLMQAGIEITQAFELDANAVKTYRHNLGGHIKHCDLTMELVSHQADADMGVFTYPCTRYSTLADIHDTRTGDDLFLHALRTIALKQFEAYIIENVPGMRAFPVVMECMQQLPGYHVQTFCPINANHWLPQNRARLIIIGTRQEFSIRPPANTRPVKLADILERDPEIKITKAITNRLSGKYRDRPIISDPQNGDNAPLCLAHYGKDRSTRLVADHRYPEGARPYTVREFARLQGLPDSFEFPVGKTAAYRQIGNGVAVPMARWAGSELVRYFENKSQRNAA